MRVLFFPPPPHSSALHVLLQLVGNEENNYTFQLAGKRLLTYNSIYYDIRNVYLQCVRERERERSSYTMMIYSNYLLVLDCVR